MEFQKIKLINLEHIFSKTKQIKCHFNLDEERDQQRKHQKQAR